jgi:hypothetical protein
VNWRNTVRAPSARRRWFSAATSSGPLYEHDDEEQFGEEKVPTPDGTHQPILTNAWNRILMHRQNDDDGDRSWDEIRIVSSPA